MKGNCPLGDLSPNLTGNHDIRQTKNRKGTKTCRQDADGQTRNLRNSGWKPPVKLPHDSLNQDQECYTQVEWTLVPIECLRLTRIRTK